MNPDTIIDQAVVDMFNAGGSDATYTPTVGDPVSCKVILTKDIDMQPGSYESEVYGSQMTIEAPLKVLGKEPDEGETIGIGSTIYRVESVAEIINDSIVVVIVTET